VRNLYLTQETETITGEVVVGSREEFFRRNGENLPRLKRL